MPISFASICPHPPILIPEVGGKEVEKIKKTKSAMETLAQELTKAEPETLIIISPHTLIYPDRMNVCGMQYLYGDLSYFGAPNVVFNFENDLDLAIEIDKEANQNGINTLLYNNGERVYQLDHGVIVPLYYLIQKLERPIKIIPVGYSLLNREKHFKFGEILSKVAQTNKNIGLIASGDLSHRLHPLAPAGYSKKGKLFDQKLITLLKEKKTNEILTLDENFIEEAGECGYRSILILLGALNNLNYNIEVLSYEGPFGVGYLVANFKLE